MYASPSYIHIPNGVPYKAPTYTADDLRKYVKCVGDIFEDLIEEHSELKKYYNVYKVHAEETRLRLVKCEAMEKPSQQV